MHRVNLTVDEALYEQARLHSFVSKKSISQIMRDGLALYLQSKTESAKEQLVLAAKDEQEILEILSADDFATEAEFAKQFDL